jgi:hypothetical protein
MSVNVNLYSGYENIDFPGSLGLKNPRIDQFIDLTDSLVTSGVREDQRAWAQVYNKLVNAVTEVQRWFWFEPATWASSGICGEGVWTTSCSAITSVVPSGNGTVTRIFPPTEFRIRLSDLIDYPSDTYATNGASGTCLFFEVVVTKNMTVDYSNMPFKETLLRQGKSYWDQIVGSGVVLVAASLAPVRDDSGIPSVEPWNYATVTPTRYRNTGYIHSLRVSCHAVRSPDHYIVRGFVYDFVSQSLNTNNYDVWKTNGNNIELVVTITKVG